MTEKICEICHESIKIRKKECEEEGVAYHIKCFVCRVCKTILNEYTVNMRRRKLYCKFHAIKLGRLQPLSKLYYNSYGSCYRIIYGSDKENRNKTEKRKGPKTAEQEAPAEE